MTDHQDLCSVRFKFASKSFPDVNLEKFQVVARSIGGQGARFRRKMGGGQVNQRGGAGSMGQGSEREKEPVGL